MLKLLIKPIKEKYFLLFNNVVLKMLSSILIVQHFIKGLASQAINITSLIILIKYSPNILMICVSQPIELRVSGGDEG